VERQFAQSIIDSAINAATFGQEIGSSSKLTTESPGPEVGMYAKALSARCTSSFKSTFADARSDTALNPARKVSEPPSLVLPKAAFSSL
jgi:hypothetical protein